MQNCYCTHLLAVRRTTVVPVEHNNEAKDNIKEGGTNNQRAQELDRTRSQRWELPQKDKRLRKKKRYSDGEDMYAKTYSSEYVFFLPIHSGYQVRWRYQPGGSHRRKVTQEEGHTGFFIHLLSAGRALFFLARRIQPFLSLVDRELELYVLTI